MSSFMDDDDDIPSLDFGDDDDHPSLDLDDELEDLASFSSLNKKYSPQPPEPDVAPKYVSLFTPNKHRFRRSVTKRPSRVSFAVNVKEIGKQFTKENNDEPKENNDEPKENNDEPKENNDEIKEDKYEIQDENEETKGDKSDNDEPKEENEDLKEDNAESKEDNDENEEANDEPKEDNDESKEDDDKNEENNGEPKEDNDEPQEENEENEESEETENYEYVHPRELSSTGRHLQNLRLRRDTERAMKQWLTPAKHRPKFTKQLREIMTGTMTVSGTKSLRKNENLIDNKLRSNPEWFTKRPDSPNSIESHASFMAETEENLQLDENCIRMREFEELTYERLRAEIIGMWTRRFVQKRTKPKVLNACFNQRISLLIKYLEEFEREWIPLQSAYLNLFVRVRLHWDASYQYYQIVSNIRGCYKEAILNRAKGAMDRFEDEIISNVTCKPTQRMHVIFLLALRQIFNVKMYGQKLVYENVLKPLATRKYKFFESKSLFRALNEENEQRENNESMDYPDISIVNDLCTDLGNADLALSRCVWPIHDDFIELDNEIQFKLYALITRFGHEVEDNPLVKEHTGNFHDELSEVKYLIKSSIYCRRRIKAIIVSALLGDFKELEVNASKILTTHIEEWMEWMIDAPNYLDKEEWTDLLNEADKDVDTLHSDKLNMCKNCIWDIYRQASYFVTEEMDEVDRLLTSQIVCAGEIILYGYNHVKEIDAFEAMVPTTVPKVFKKAREEFLEQLENERRQREQIEEDLRGEWQPPLPQPLFSAEERLEQALNEVEVPCYAAFLLQGQFFVFETQQMKNVILTVDVTKLHHIHTDFDCFTMIETAGDRATSVSFGTLYPGHMNTWRASLQNFCNFTLRTQDKN